MSVDISGECLTLDRYIDPESVATLPTLGRHSVDSLAIVGRCEVDIATDLSLDILRRHISIEYRSNYGGTSVKCR